MTLRKFEPNEDIIKTVVARLSTIPPTVKISIRHQGSFTRDELINHVLSGDDTGKIIVEMHLNYLKEVVNI